MEKVEPIDSKQEYKNMLLAIRVFEEEISEQARCVEFFAKSGMTARLEAELEILTHNASVLKVKRETAEIRKKILEDKEND